MGEVLTAKDAAWKCAEPLSGRAEHGSATVPLLSPQNSIDPEWTAATAGPCCPISLIIDGRGIIRFCGDPKLFGGDRGDVDGQLLRNFIPALVLPPTGTSDVAPPGESGYVAPPWQLHSLETLAGRSLDVEVSVRPLPVDGQVAMLVVLRAPQAGRSSMRCIDDLLARSKRSAEAICVTDNVGRVVFVNSAFELLTGYTAAEAGMLIWAAGGDSAFSRDKWPTLLDGNEVRAVVNSRTKDGRVYREEQRIRPFVDVAGRVSHFVATCRNLSDGTGMRHGQGANSRLEACINGASDHLLVDRLEQAMARADRHTGGFALLLVELDLASEMGTDSSRRTGDETPRDIASELKSCLRDSDAVTRTSQYGFAVIVERGSSREQVDNVVDKIVGTLGTAVESGCAPPARIGGCIFPDDGTDPDTLIAHARSGLAEAKATGSVCKFRQSLRNHARRDGEALEMLRSSRPTPR
jgi:PAS domain S-box-containing protein